MATRTRIEALTELFVNFDQVADDARIAIYLKFLAHLTDEQVAEAVDAAIRRCRWMPTVAELLDLVCGSEKDRAIEAWELALNHVRTGRRQDVPADVERAVEMIGGWDEIGQPPKDQLHWVRQRFLDAFPAAIRAVDKQRKALEPGGASGLIEDLSDKLDAQRLGEPRENADLENENEGEEPPEDDSPETEVQQ